VWVKAWDAVLVNGIGIFGAAFSQRFCQRSYEHRRQHRDALRWYRDAIIYANYIGIAYAVKSIHACRLRVIWRAILKAVLAFNLCGRGDEVIRARNWQ